MSAISTAGSAGIIETQTFTFGEVEPRLLENGESLGPITLAYETYGQLNEDRSNAIVLCHALSLPPEPPDTKLKKYCTGGDCVSVAVVAVIAIADVLVGAGGAANVIGLGDGGVVSADKHWKPVT